MTAPPRPARLAALTATALLAFAANSLLTRAGIGAGAIDATTFTALRLVSGALVLVALAARGGHGRTVWQPRGFAGPLALFAYAWPFSLAYVRLGAATGALLLFGVVQLTLLGSAWLRGERPRPLAWLGFALALGGLAWLMGPQAQRPDPLGALLMAIAGVAWAIYTLLGRTAGAPLLANARSFLFATPLAALAFGLAPDARVCTGTGAMLAITSGALASGVGYAIWYRAVPRLGVARAAFAQLAVPAIAALGAVTLLGEPFSRTMAVATAVVLGGTALALAAKHGHTGGTRARAIRVADPGWAAMAMSLFEPRGLAAMLARVDALRSDSVRQWGTMDVAQMLAHCQQPLRVALGELPLRRGLVGLLFGRLAKRMLLSPKPWKNGMATAPEFKIVDRRDFAQEQTALRALVERFGRGGPNALTKQPHPFFGPLTADEWQALQWRHLDHHLRQFGA